MDLGKKVKVRELADRYGVNSYRFESFLRNRGFEIEDKFMETYIEENLGEKYINAYISVHKKADAIGMSFTSLDSYIQQKEGAFYKKFYESMDEEKIDVYASKCRETK